MRKIFKDMIYNNKWLWFHVLGGGILSKILMVVFKEPQVAVTLVLITAVIWEIYEYIRSDVRKIYGSKKRFFADSLGDILGAVIMAIIIVL